MRKYYLYAPKGIKKEKGSAKDEIDYPDSLL